MADEVKEPVEQIKTTETTSESESASSKLSSQALELMSSETARIATTALVGGVAGAAAAVAVGSALEAGNAEKKLADSGAGSAATRCIEEEQSTLEKAGRIALDIGKGILFGPVAPLILPDLFIDDSKKNCVENMDGKEFIDDKTGTVETPSTTDKIIEEIKSTPSDMLEFVKEHPYLAVASVMFPSAIPAPIKLAVGSKIDKFVHSH